MRRSETDRVGEFDPSSDRRFIDYYAKESQSVETVERFARIMARSLQFISSLEAKPPLDVIDVGCGAGARAAVEPGGAPRARNRHQCVPYRDGTAPHRMKVRVSTFASAAPRNSRSPPGARMSCSFQSCSST